MKHIRARLLGPFHLSVAERHSVVPATRKSIALLVYLTVHRDTPVTREKLSLLLWPELDSEAGRSNLRQCLAVLRKELEHAQRECIVNSGSAICLKGESVDSDIEEFDSLVSNASIDSLQKLRALCRGEFVEGFALGEEDFDEWLIAQRRLYRERYVRAMTQLLKIHDEMGSSESSIDLAVELLALDPLQESVHRSLMSAYGKLGRRRAIQNQFAECQEILASELGLQPSAETKRLFRSLLSQLPEKLEKGSDDEHFEEIVRPNEMPARRHAASRQAGASNTFRYVWGALACAFILILVGEFRLNNEPAVELPVTVSVITKPSIAVVPFANLSADAGQEYFSDGLTEDLITDLSRVSGLTVISRSSSFSFRHAKLSKKALAAELGVRYIVDGSVRREGNRVRINASLVDTETGANVWADRYDRGITDILAMQDELTKTIASELSVSFTGVEQAQFERTQKVDAEAYDLLLRGLQPFRTFTSENNKVARSYFQKSIAADSSYARAHANLALTYGREIVFRYSDKQAQHIERGLAAARQAETLDDTLPQVQFTKAVLFLASKNHKEAVSAARRSIALDPNYADGHAVLAQTLSYSGLLDEALTEINTAKSLNPVFPFSYLFVEGHIYYLQGHYERALAVLKDSTDRNPSFYLGRLLLAATYARLNLAEEAEWQIAESSMLNPGISLDIEEAAAIYLKPQHLDHYLEGLQLAGLGG